jgi:hypothetical protein
MALFQGALFLFFGAGLLAVTYRSFTTGWLPSGPNGLKGRLEFRRSEQPFGFWLMFVLYSIGGVALFVLGVRVLLGVTEPLPLN